MLKILVKMGNKIGRRRPLVDEQFTKPQGLYIHKDLDHKKLRKLILAGHLAPCYVGSEEPSSDLEECPICFLYYPSLNRSKCCAKGMCTECFLQMKAPQTARPTQCPFCKTPSYCVEYKGAKTIEEKGREQAEEQKVIEAKIRIRLEEQEQEQERVRKREQDILEGRIPLPPPPPPPAAGDPLPELPLALNRNWLAADSNAGGPLARPPRSGDSEPSSANWFGDVDSLYLSGNFSGSGSQSELGSSSTSGEGTGGRGASPHGSGSSDRSGSGWSMFGTVGRPPLGRTDGARGSGPRSLFRTETVRAIEADSLWFRSGASGESTPSAADTAFALATATPGFLTRSAISPPHPHEAAAFGSPMSTDGSISTPFSHFQRSIGSTPFPRWEEGPEFDMDLEEIMIMEAIWQSLRLGEGGNSTEAVASSLGQISSPSGAQRPSAGARSTGGLAGAIAALAERQAESTSRLSIVPGRVAPSTPEALPGASEARRVSDDTIELQTPAENSGGAKPASNTSSEVAQLTEDQSYEAVRGEWPGISAQQQEVGPCSEEIPSEGTTTLTEVLGAGAVVSSSTCSADGSSIPVKTISPDEAPTTQVSAVEPETDGQEGEKRAEADSSEAEMGTRLHSGEATTSNTMLKGPHILSAEAVSHAVPESYEDQIMYAIALSLAESQAVVGGG